LVASKPSQAPVAPGQPDHSVSPAHVDFGDGTRQDVTGEQHVPHTFPGPGTYRVTATATDEQGQTRTWSRTVLIDRPPVAVVDAARRKGRSVLTASVRGGDHHAVAAHWAFADGSTADGLSLTRRASQSAAGTVTVIDGAGDSATASF
jgi:PKD repeat protein